MDITGIGAIADFARDVVNKIWPDATQKQKDEAAARVLALTQEYNLQQGQIDINKIEAASSSVFVSGARPFILWTCGVSFGYAALVEPLMRFVSVVWFHYTGQFPVIDTNLTLQVMMALLGLGLLRSWDKKNGTA